MKRFFKEFKDFALKGNVIDLAVGVIIGGAFGTIVTSLINDVIMPLVGLIFKGANFTDKFVILGKLPEGVTAEQVTSLEKAAELGVNTFNYGAFITAVINFIIMAFIIFLMVKAINKATSLKKKEEAAPTTKKCPFCCTEIDLKACRCPNCTSELPKE
jgi:large conductance mechanosensitive channel